MRIQPLEDESSIAAGTSYREPEGIIDMTAAKWRNLLQLPIDLKYPGNGRQFGVVRREHHVRRMLFCTG